MKARGWINSGRKKKWWATFYWIPAGSEEGNPTYLETGFYLTEKVAKQAAEGYAKTLGLAIEWEEA